MALCVRHVQHARALIALIAVRPRADTALCDMLSYAQPLGTLESAALEAHAAAVVAKLEHSDSGVRQAAVELLDKLKSKALEAQAAAVVAKLEHSDSGARRAAVATLGKLESAALEAHGSGGRRHTGRLGLDGAAGCCRNAAQAGW